MKVFSKRTGLTDVQRVWCLAREDREEPKTGRWTVVGARIGRPCPVPVGAGLRALAPRPGSVADRVGHAVACGVVALCVLNVRVGAVAVFCAVIAFAAAVAGQVATEDDGRVTN